VLTTDNQSGVTFHEAQVALAKIYVGSDDVKGDTDEVVNIEKAHDASTGADQIGKKDTVESAVKLPKTVDEVSLMSPAELAPTIQAKQIIQRFESALGHSDRNM
jgi:phospholipase D1/2